MRRRPEKRDVGLTLAAADDSALRPEEQTDTVGHWTQRNINRVETLVLMRKVPAADLPRRCQSRRRGHALSHCGQKQMNGLAIVLSERARRGCWDWCRRRRCHTRSPDDRGERLQHLLDLQLGQVPVCCQRTRAVGHDRPSMRVQAKRSLYGAKPGRLIVAR